MPPPDYGDAAYWEARYRASPTPFEWLAPASALTSHVLPLLAAAREPEVLIPGCGTSALGPALYACGVRNLSCIDWSEAAIAHVAARDEALEEMDVRARGRRMSLAATRATRAPVFG